MECGAWILCIGLFLKSTWLSADIIEVLCTTVTGRILQIRQKKCKRCADASTLLRTSCYVWWCSPEAVLSDGVHHSVCARIGSQHHESLIHDRSPSYEQMSQHFFPFFMLLFCCFTVSIKTFKSICWCTVVAQKRNQMTAFVVFESLWEATLVVAVTHRPLYHKKCWFCD